jgi:hypothetical protein
MQAVKEHWSCEAVPDGPPGFPFAILSSGEILAWVKRPADAAFITTARDEVRQLVLQLYQKGQPAR